MGYFYYQPHTTWCSILYEWIIYYDGILLLFVCKVNQTHVVDYIFGLMLNLL